MTLPRVQKALVLHKVESALLPSKFCLLVLLHHFVGVCGAHPSRVECWTSSAGLLEPYLHIHHRCPIEWYSLLFAVSPFTVVTNPISASESSDIRLRRRVTQYPLKSSLNTVKYLDPLGVGPCIGPQRSVWISCPTSSALVRPCLGGGASCLAYIRSRVLTDQCYLRSILDRQCCQWKSS